MMNHSKIARVSQMKIRAGLLIVRHSGAGEGGRFIRETFRRLGGPQRNCAPIGATAGGHGATEAGARGGIV
jgi:hypothetical protein